MPDDRDSRRRGFLRDRQLPRPVRIGERAFAKVLDRDFRVRSIRRILEADPKLPDISDEKRELVAALRPRLKRFHGTKVPLTYFPPWMVGTDCADKFGYMSTSAIRNATKLPFNVGTQALLGELGAFMSDTSQASGADSIIPAGFTYVGQFVDHDITLDISSSLDQPTNANTINNMRMPSLELDSLYGRGPALDPFLYDFSGAPTAIRFQLGSNRPQGPGGPAGFAQMKEQKDFDLPRIVNALDPGQSSFTAVIGDPRNDENLIVSQFHHAMLKFHNEVVDLLEQVAFNGDIFTEAKRIVTHHYQWAVVNDFLKRICDPAAVDQAINSVTIPLNGKFRMPVEFAVGAYRFGHSMIREQYWLSHAQINASLKDVFDFNRKPNLPVLSNWVVDFNAFFETGIPVPVFNRAKRIDSILAPGLTTLPGMSGVLAALATRNLRRGLALGLPSGQGMAQQFGVAALTEQQLTSGLPAAEVAVLNKNGKLLLKKTPLWYYCLREAMVLEGGDRLGPVGGRIVAETFARILKRDPNSYLNQSGGFTPNLPAQNAGDFTFADLVTFANVTVP